MLHNALVEIRFFVGDGQIPRAFDLANAFHNLPDVIWSDQFSMKAFLAALAHYCMKWPKPFMFDYLERFRIVQTLGETSEAPRSARVRRQI